MIVRFAATAAIAFAIVSITVAATQVTGNDEHRAAIMVVRAINTAENAMKQSSGQYVPLSALMGHQAMQRVRADIAVTNDAVTHQGRILRMVLSPDGMHYQVMVVPAQTCGTAVFSDEGGLIYTGKVLDC